MTTNKLFPDDPRLTAYALDELEPAERSELEQLLRDDPAARAAVDEIRSAASRLGSALRNEPAPACAPVAVPTGNPTHPTAGEPVVHRAPILRFPQLYFYISGLAAACFAVIYAIHETRDAARADQMAGKSLVAAREREMEPSAFSTGQEARMPEPAKAVAGVGPLRLVQTSRALEDRFFSTKDTDSSTFPLRVGRASYDAVRALLRRGIRPPRAMVQVDEMINAFAYSWPAPAEGEAFASVLEETEAPWAPGHRLVRVGLKARAGPGQPVADDARVEVDFNPGRVLAWRLVGFERDGGAAGVRVATGETIQAGDAVTVLYELVPVVPVASGTDPVLLRLALTYREPASGESQLFERTLTAGDATFAVASPDMKFATAVAAFGLRLRDSTAQAPVALGAIEQWARAGGDNAERVSFLGLVQAAEQMVH